MKRFLSLVFLLTLTLATVNSAMAQTSKEDKKKEKAEKKQWKQKAKAYAKEPFTLRDDLDNCSKQIRDLSAKNAELQAKLRSCQTSSDSLQNMLNAKNAELAAANARYEKLQAAFEAQKNVTDKGITPGLSYKVQCGAFVHFDMNKYLQETDKNFEGETSDGMNKYTMGSFRDFNVANAFKEDVRKLGIKDAWVVPYIDGRRVTLDEANAYLAKQGAAPIPNTGTGGGATTRSAGR